MLYISPCSTEIWKYNLEFYCKILKNYHFYYSPPVDTNIGGVGIPGAPIKNNPIENILYLRNCSRFFFQKKILIRGRTFFEYIGCQILKNNFEGDQLNHTIGLL